MVCAERNNACFLRAYHALAEGVGHRMSGEERDVIGDQKRCLNHFRVAPPVAPVMKVARVYGS